jgi:lysophospholipase L1-like esterase
MRKFTLLVITATLFLGTILAPIAGALPASPTYAALGDSVAAGSGLPVVSGATKLDKKCERSSQSYPYQIATQLQTSVTNLACRGAKVDEGIYGKQSRSGTRVAPQLQTAFENGTPDLMTVTIGANDARWVQAIRKCYVRTCGSKFDEVRAKVYRADLRIELYRMLSEINQKSEGNPPQVLISGYYAPFSGASCTDTNRISATEQTWLNDQTAQLNQAIQSVIPYFSFASYVPLDFSGHELCSTSPWVQGASSKAPLHPTAAGQTAIANSFIGAIE